MFKSHPRQIWVVQKNDYSLISSAGNRDKLPEKNVLFLISQEMIYVCMRKQKSYMPIELTKTY